VSSNCISIAAIMVTVISQRRTGDGKERASFTTTARAAADADRNAAERNSRFRL
jgi:hypothetical protein